MTTETASPRGYLARTLERDRLVERLETGWGLVGAARTVGDAAKLTRLEDHWLTLLRTYEALDDELLAAGPVQAPLFETTGRLP